MITEDYVSFETAKLLREKGFTANIHEMYDHDGKFCEATFTDVEPYYSCYAPTLQMVMKWLRTEHNIFFNVNYFRLDVGDKWVCLTIWLPYKNGCEFSVEGPNIETVYETAIRYCLENLI